MAEHNLPWTYRPREFDDWGWIRDAEGCLAACARGEKGNKLHDEHRRDGTDPYGDYAVLIVNAVNAYQAAQDEIKRLRDFVNWVDTWVSNPASAYSVSAMEGLFGMARDRISALSPAHQASNSTD